MNVETWFVKRAGMIDGTVWVPVGSRPVDALIEAKREHGGNAVAVRRPGQAWQYITRTYHGLRYVDGATALIVDHNRRVRLTLNAARDARCYGDRATAARYLAEAGRVRRAYGYDLSAVTA